MATTATKHSPEEYAARLAELTDDLLIARQRVEISCHARDRAVEALAHHLAVADGDERVAIVGDSLLIVGRSADRYSCRIFAIHARA